MQTIDQLEREYTTLFWIYKGLLKNLYKDKFNKRELKEYMYIEKEFRRVERMKRIFERL